MNDLSVLTEFLRTEFQRERDSDFARLRRVPSGRVLKFLDYFSALSEPARKDLAEALALVAVCAIRPTVTPTLHPYQAGNVAYRRFADALTQMADWEYYGTRDLRMLLAASRNPADKALMQSVPSEVLQNAEAIQPVTAAGIRKLVEAALPQLFPEVAISHTGADWKYEGIYRGFEVCVHIDYGGMGDQLRYAVTVKERSPTIRLVRVNYEHLMGLAVSGWNLVEQSNVEPAIELLKELVVYCVELPARLPV